MYVADSSFFVSATAVNPTLTIIANALRVADTITQRRGRTAFQAQPANQGLPVITEMAVTGLGQPVADWIEATHPVEVCLATAAAR